MENMDQQVAAMLARMGTLEQQVRRLERENQQYHRQMPPERLNRRQLFMGGTGVLGAALGGALLGHHRDVRADTTSSTTTINYQGRLTDNQGSPVNNTVSMTFALYNSSTPGQGVQRWQGPSQQPVAVQNGLFSIYLTIPLSVLSLPETLYVDIAVAGVEMTPREQLSALPYSLLGQPNGIATLDGFTKVVQAAIRQTAYYQLSQDFSFSQAYQPGITNINLSVNNWGQVPGVQVALNNLNNATVVNMGVLSVYTQSGYNNWLRYGTSAVGASSSSGGDGNVHLIATNQSIPSGSDQNPAPISLCGFTIISGLSGTSNLPLYYQAGGGNPVVCKAASLPGINSMALFAAEID